MNRLPVLAGLLVAACSVGPDWRGQYPPNIRSLTEAPVPDTLDANGAVQRLVPGRDIPGDWWKLYNNPALDTLVRRALAANPSLDAAQAALRLARENAYAQEGSYFPSAAAAFTPSRNKTATGNLSPNSASGSPYYNVTTAQVTVSFVPDVFGANRRAVESLVAQAENQRFQLEATYLTLTANVVTAAIQEASLREQIAATERVVAFAKEGLRILNTQRSLGQVAGVEVFAQAALLAQAQATLPPLVKQLNQQRTQLAAMTGRLPDQPVPETFRLADIHLPAELPVSIPSQVVAQRPDIRQADENARSFNAQIGVAIANRIPAIALTANVGSSPGGVSQLFTPGNGFFTLAGSITQPLFQGGQLLHRQRAAEAAYEQAQAQYYNTVVTAFQNVADALQALKSDADAVLYAQAAEEAANNSLRIIQTQLRLGQVGYLALLTAQSTELQASLILAQAQANRLADAAALMQSLGGGWWNRDDDRAQTNKSMGILGVVGFPWR